MDRYNRSDSKIKKYTKSNFIKTRTRYKPSKRKVACSAVGEKLEMSVFSYSHNCCKDRSEIVQFEKYVSKGHDVRLLYSRSDNITKLACSQRT